MEDKSRKFKVDQGKIRNMEVGESRWQKVVVIFLGKVLSFILPIWLRFSFFYMYSSCAEI